MHKFFTTELDASKATIRGEDHKHLSRVLRLSSGEKVVVNDEKGQDYEGIIDAVHKDYTEIILTEKIATSNESNIRITLYQGIPKATKLDLIVQKNTELGVHKIVPVVTERVIVSQQKEFKKLDRLKRIAYEAAKQSKRSFIPVITEPITFDELLMGLNEDVLVVPYENAENFGFKALKKELAHLDSIGILIGPEGGFSDKEIERLENKGAKIVTLGKRILRTETAGFTAMVMIQMLYGDMGGE